MYNPKQNQSYGSRALSTLMATALTAAACTGGPAAEGPLQGTIERKLNDPEAKRLVLFVQPIHSSPSLGVRYDQKGAVKVVLPYGVASAAGQDPKVIDEVCGQDPYSLSSPLFLDKCFFDGQVKKSGDTYETTSIKGPMKAIGADKELTVRFAESFREAAENQKKREAEEAKKATEQGPMATAKAWLKYLTGR